jgi:methyl-accepting chemotaxis protein
MDQVTQQNAALVEEMAAAASSLKSQAQDLVQTVAVFKTSGNSHGTALTSIPVRSGGTKSNAFQGSERRSGAAAGSPLHRSAKPAAKPRPAAAVTALPKLPKAAPSAPPAPSTPAPKSAAPAGDDDGWETF